MKFKRKTKTVNSKSESSAPAITYIAESTQVNADIECKHDMRISGTIEGETKAHKKLILTGSGTIKGTIHSLNADISGKVIGDVRASEKLTLRASAIIEGRIFTKILSIEDGAQIKGSLKVGPEIDINKKTKDSSSILKRNKSTSKAEDTDESEDKSISRKDDTDSATSSGASKQSA